MTTLPVVVAARNASGLTTTANAVITVTDTNTRGLITAFNPVSDNWNAPNNVVIDGQQFFCENANKAWSLTKVDDYTVRMEVRPNDLWSDDGTARSEILTVQGAVNTQPVTVAWNYMVEPGPVQALAWCSSCQVHDGNPFISISILNDRMNVLLNQATGPSPATPYSDPNPLVRGRVYAMKMEFTKGPAGSFKLWRDNVLLMSYSGSLGSGSDGATVKFGIYEGWPNNVSAPLAARYSNIAIDFGAVPPPPPLPSGLNQVGVTSLGGNDSGNAGSIFAQKVTLPTAGVLQSLSFYCNNAQGNLKMAVYADNNGKPGAKKAETAGAAATVGWNTKPVTTQVALQPGDYWMAYEVSSNSLGFKNGGGGQFVWATQAYGTMPDNFPTSQGPINDSWSFYMTVNVP